MTLEERRARGDAARQMLANHGKTFAAIERDYAEDMLRSDGAERREAIHAEYKGFKRFVSKLMGWEQDGQLAVAEIERAKG